MKKFLLTVIMTAALMATVAGCGDKAADTPTPTVATGGGGGGGELSQASEAPADTETPAVQPTATPENATEEPTTEPSADVDLGGAEEALNKLLAEMANILGDGKAPMAFISDVTAETSEGNIGLTSEEFGQYVKSACVSTAAIMSQAHEIAVIECASEAEAREASKLVAAGFNPRKWICVAPERCVTFVAGRYVLLAVSHYDTVDAAAAAFKNLTGAEGEAETFFDRADMGDVEMDGAGGGGLLLIP